ncbi:angiotensin-converting enzyme-like isoform X2 [Periplaneta americana]|uniref:angiotensin-converting enzyme-like isoform X2 n=1 Tax=Periplaneta americana TaxID=6978 RepID=UPI0037E79E14
MFRAASLLCVLLVTDLVVAAPRQSTRSEEDELAAYLAGDFERLASEACRLYNVASWNYNTDVENATAVEELTAQTLAFAQFEKEQWEQHFRGVDWQNFQNETVKRQLKTLSVLGISALNDSALSELNSHQTNMTTIYSSAKICPYDNQNCDLATDGLSLDPGMEKVISSSRDYDELTYVWKAWRDVSGAKMRDDYKVYVELSNLAAQINGFSDNGEMWRNEFETDNFVDDMMKLWQQVEPLYLELHTFVKRRLRGVYGDLLGDDDLIPAHVLGNMWAQSWENIYDIVKPYPDAALVNVTSSLIEQGYDPLRMFETSDAFYQSLGLPENSMSYNRSEAMIEKPTDGRVVVCHASAWDFCDRKDFRIKMCTKVNMEDFVTIHHEMGHIQYYIQYKNQPYALRSGANPGFHEAVGDTIALSVSTPQHLEKVGLLQNYTDTYNDSINSLMQIALQKVAFLPFGLLIDMWRWDVFSGKTPESQWNAHWWELRESIQKVKAPVPRSEQDFDPGAKYHVPADSQYISYFVAHILQFQFQKALCVAADQYDPNDPNRPLHKCDIFKSEKAGTLLSDGLKLGGSRHWSETLYIMTGEREMNGSALLEYFQPLYEFLQAENSQNAAAPRSDGSAVTNDGSAEVQDQTVPIVVGGVVLAIVVVVIVGYLVFRRRAMKRNAAT